MTFTPQARPGAGPRWSRRWPACSCRPPCRLIAGECGDWRGGLKADFSDPSRIRFAGGYPAACGERIWPVAYADPRSYARARGGGPVAADGRQR